MGLAVSHTHTSAWFRSRFPRIEFLHIPLDVGGKLAANATAKN